MERLLPVDTAVTVLVNVVPLIDDTDFKTRETSVAYNASGLDLVWTFETPAGVITQTAVTPTDTGGDYDWAHVGDAIYKIEIPASGGASINNDAEGYGYFSGVATGVLPWVGPTYAFVPAHVVNGLVTGTDNLQVETVALANNVITAAAHDESTAFPLTAADTGATAVARTGEDGDTLETLSDEIALIPTGSGLDADGVRAAVGLGSANLDTQLADLPTVSEFEARTVASANYGTAANQTTILNRIGAFTGTGVNTILGFLKALMSKSATLPSDVGGTFAVTTDSVEAIRDRGDNAWLSYTTVTSTSTSQSFFVPRSLTKSIIQNDSYSLARRPLVFLDPGGTNAWPLAEADYAAITAIKFTAKFGVSSIAVIKNSSVSDWVISNGSSTTAEINVALTSSDTAVTVGDYSYDLQVTLSDGDVITLEIGTLTVIDDVTDPN